MPPLFRPPQDVLTRVGRRLHSEQARVAAVETHKLLVRASSDEPACSRKTMRSARSRSRSDAELGQPSGLGQRCKRRTGRIPPARQGRMSAHPSRILAVA